MRQVDFLERTNPSGNLEGVKHPANTEPAEGEGGKERSSVAAQVDVVEACPAKAEPDRIREKNPATAGEGPSR